MGMEVGKTSGYQPADNAKAAGTEQKTSGVNQNYGKTVGEPKLSEQGAKYYEQLKKKFGNYEFLLVSKDEKAYAQANAAKFANPYKPVVLIDEEKIEKMASDPKFRKQYEDILSGAKSQLSQLKSSMESSGANVQGYGMKVNDDGTASFFAVLKKSSADQKARIEKKTAQNKAEKKAAQKKADAKKAEKKAEEKRAADKAKRDEWEEDVDTAEYTRINRWDDSDVEVFTADSVEDLIKKVGGFMQNEMMNSVQTDTEKMVGQHIDFKG